MPEITVPETLSELSVNELQALAAQVHEAIVELNADRTEENVAAMQELGKDYARIDDMITALSARDTRAQEVLDRLPEGNEGAEASTETEDSEGAEEEGEEEASTEKAEEASTEDEAEGEAAAEEASTETEEQTPSETIELSETISMAPREDDKPLTAGDVTQALSNRRPESAAPVATTQAELTTTLFANHGGEPTERVLGDGLADVAQEIVKRMGSLGSNIPHGVFEQITVATAVTAFPDEMSTAGDEKKNFAKFEAARTTQVNQRAAVVASGGICAPFSPSYDIFRKAQPSNPIEQCLPTVQAPRGGIRFIVPPDFRDAFAAIGTTTCVEDKEGYVSGDPAGPTPDKPCTTVPCPPVQECCVTAVSTCVRFGNLGYKTFPEQVTAFMADVAVAFACAKEQLYLDQIDANSTQVVGCKTGYGSSRDIMFNLILAGSAYRERHKMDPSATLTLLLPHWVRGQIKTDLIMDANNGGSAAFGISNAQIDAAIRACGFDICWYNVDTSDVDPTDPAVSFDAPQEEGPLNKYPATFKAYIFCPGTFVRLDCGTLDLGLVRDSTLNKTNDLELFAEQWVEVCMVGIESVALELCPCPNGGVPEAAPLYAC